MSKIRVARFFLLWGLVLSFGSMARAQVSTGTPPFGSFGGGPDVINLANLNAHITVPVLKKSGRGMPFFYNLVYDTSVWQPISSGSTLTWEPAFNFGWVAQTAITTGYVSYTELTQNCDDPPPEHNQYSYFQNWVYHDPYGINHPFSGEMIYDPTDCQIGTQGTLNASSGDGYTLATSLGSHGQILQPTITFRNGLIRLPPLNLAGGLGASGTATDRNGNEITTSSSSGSTTFTDTLGTTALTVAGSATPASPLTLTYTPPAGGSAIFTVKYTAYTVQTNFGCSGITEYSASNVSLLTEIDQPDGTKYTFTYEATPGHTGDVTGRLASMALPTGGTISYAYSGGSNGITCADGSAATLTRTTPDTGTGSWTYAHSESGTAWTTTITDPQSNSTTINFQGIYETERQVHQGASTLLKTVFTCYNGNTNTSTCNSTAVGAVTQRSVFTQWPGGQQSRKDTFYNGSQLLTEKDEYAYGSGAPGSIVRKTLTAYASLGNGIASMPATVTVEDGSANIKSQTTYTYDQGSVTATSGTPQQVAVSGSRGNATTVSSQVSTSTSLSKTYTYYDTGTVSTATDVNGAVTTYAYGSGTSCGNSFPTSVTEPLSLSRSMAWNCTGGVETSVTDENGKTTSATYSTDADFWRPNATTDQESNATNITYVGRTSVESSLLFSTASTADGLTTVDGLGRVHVTQRKQSPSSTEYDSVETDYDSLGRPSQTTLPYQAMAGTPNSMAPRTTTTYDALSRKLTVEDTEASPRTVTFAYNQNDTYRTLSPAPTGENTKRKQFEHDALGRLTSVCEVTSATGSGACAQTSGVTGYWTTYTYDAMNRLLTVTQNAQSSGSQQTRTYAYDELGRMISEINPESGTTTYKFDTDATCGTSNGNLVKKIDAVGNTTCLAYDSLHRPTSATYSGPYSSSTPNKYFVYDAATVNSVAMSNVKGRLAEAYTATSSTGTKITDIGLSYSVRGEASDVYESTPHSGGYYHSSATYWANGALDALTAKYGTSSITGLPTFTYAPDGEGRINTVSATAGQNPVTGTTYNVASLATQVTLGSSDSDSFTYDPATNRITKYTFSVNGQSVVGTLTWNSIGTLEDLSVTDPFFSGGNQSCAYTHDDLSRIASANCGSPWSQTFSYDAFGNLSKSGTVSFQPTYSYLTNRMTMVGSSTPSYDPNGNATNDTAHTYAWDAAGRPVTVDSVALTYDALGRMAEQNRSGAYSQIVYTPRGGKFAIMNGSTLTKAFVSLTGGSQAVYTSSGLAYYRHSDWIGSSRFASTPTRTMYFDGAYAPFGEAYAETGTADLSFTGMNQDAVANLYDFPAREFNDIHGRWPSPDPAGISAVRLRNPQTWNRYAYVGNNPLRMIDPSGLCGEDEVVGDDVTGVCPPLLPSDGDSGGDGDSLGDGSDDDNPPDINGNPDVPPACGEAVCGPPGVADPPLPYGGAFVACVTPEACTPEAPIVQIATFLQNTDTNVFYIEADGVLAGACGAVFAQCAAALTSVSLFLTSGSESATGPDTGHNPDDGPNGGSTLPEPVPISGPPTAGSDAP